MTIRQVAAGTDDDPQGCTVWSQSLLAILRKDLVLGNSVLKDRAADGGGTAPAPSETVDRQQACGTSAQHRASKMALAFF